MTFQVLDSEQKRPIREAEVRVVDPDPLTGRGIQAGATDDQGEVTLVIPADLEGALSPNQQDIAADFHYRWLEVSADGYVTQNSPLSAIAPAKRDLSQRNPTPIPIALERGTTPDAGVEEFVGEYTTRYDNHSFTVTADGRFFAAVFYRHAGSYRKTFGFVRVEDSCLVPEPIDRDGDAVLPVPDPEEPIVAKQYRPLRDRSGPRTNAIPIVAAKYHRVPWGQRLFLIDEGDELKFCNAVNLKGKNNDRLDYFYLRKELGDPPINGVAERFRAVGRIVTSTRDARDQPIDGLPQLPEPWMPYVLPKPVTGHVTEVYWDGRAKIDLGRNDGLRVGMDLCFPKSDSCGLKVIEVEKTSSLVGYDEPQFCHEGLEKGSVVTSRYDFARRSLD